MKICTIIAEDEVVYKHLSSYLGNYPIELTREVKLDNISIPTLIVGWQTVKKNFHTQNIFDKFINETLSWTYNNEEDKEKSEKAIEKFINKSIKEWLPKAFKMFDPFFSKDTLENFLSKSINPDEIVYFYFYNEALYVYNDNKSFVINVKSYMFIEKLYKTNFTNIFNKFKTVVLSYKNISPYVNFKELGYVYSFEIIRWVRYRQEVTQTYFNLIPGFEINKYIPFIMSKVSNFNLSEEEKKSVKRACFRDGITEWLSQQTINFRKDFKKEGLSFIFEGKSKLLRVSYSNKRTLTGRITPIDKYNPQNLPKNTNDREQIVSRFNGGKIVVFDYTSFEARIGLYFCGNEEFIKTYRKKDLHHKTATIIFKRENVNIEEREFAKSINHSILYGSSKNSVIKKVSHLGTPEEIYFRVREFLAPLLEKSKQISEKFEETGYVVNDWGTIVYPKKNYAAYNNYIQSTATEILIDKISEIKEFLSTYNSKFLFQVHDSLIFDINPNEKEIVKELAKIVMKYKGLFFSINYSTGVDYKNLTNPIEVLDYSCI